jgi:protein TonB
MRTIAALVLSIILHILLLHFLPAPAQAKIDIAAIQISLREAPSAPPESPAPITNEPPAAASQPSSPPQLAESPSIPTPPENKPVETAKKRETPVVKPKKVEKTTPQDKKPVTAPPKTETPSAETTATTKTSRADVTSAMPSGSATGNPETPRARATPGTGTATSARPAIVDVSSLVVRKKISPEYPMVSRKRKDQGTVTLLVTIKSGRVTSVEMERGSGHTPLDEAAMRAVKGWEFDSSGYGETVVARIPFVFTLK